MVAVHGLEPRTQGVWFLRSTNWAIPPYLIYLDLYNILSYMSTLFLKKIKKIKPAKNYGRLFYYITITWVARCVESMFLKKYGIEQLMLVILGKYRNERGRLNEYHALGVRILHAVFE